MKSHCMSQLSWPTEEGMNKKVSEQEDETVTK